MDHLSIQDDEAVIEWSMSWVPKQTGEAEILRGSEWYVFKGQHICEIRFYHCNYYVNAVENPQLHDFDYLSRGYRQG
jgi:hypothetical protein